MKAKKLAEELLDGEKHHTLRSMIGDGGALLDRILDIRHIDEVSQLVKKAVEPRDKCPSPQQVLETNCRNKPVQSKDGHGHGRKASFKTSSYKSKSKVGGARCSNVARLASKFNSLLLEEVSCLDQEQAGVPAEQPRRSVCRHSSLLKVHHVGSVKATIRIFEESARHGQEAATSQRHHQQPEYCKVVLKRSSGKLVAVHCADIDEPSADDKPVRDEWPQSNQQACEERNGSDRVALVISVPDKLAPVLAESRNDLATVRCVHPDKPVRDEWPQSNQQACQERNGGDRVAPVISVPNKLAPVLAESRNDLATVRCVHPDKPVRDEWPQSIQQACQERNGGDRVAPVISVPDKLAPVLAESRNDLATVRCVHPDKPVRDEWPQSNQQACQERNGGDRVAPVISVPDKLAPVLAESRNDLATVRCVHPDKPVRDEWPQSIQQACQERNGGDRVALVISVPDKLAPVLDLVTVKPAATQVHREAVPAQLAKPSVLGVEQVRPNRSFLWGRPCDDGGIAAEQTYQAVRALLVDTADGTDDYDDVCPPCDGVPFIDDYDDVGVYSEEAAPAADKHSYEYCDPDPAVSYDDCEGEGYELVGDGEAPQGEANIYDDVKCVPDARARCDDGASISNCYESIYSLGTAEDRGQAKNTPPCSLAGSFCDKSNSLYGATESRFDSASVSQASTLSADYATRPMSQEQPGAGSEASDEWMDMDGSHSEGESEAVKTAHERLRARRSPKWSRKVRRQRCRSTRRLTGAAHVFVSSSSVLYLGDLRKLAVPHEVLCDRAHNLVSLRAIIYVGETQESQEMTFFLEQEGGETSTESETDHHYEMLYEVVGQNNHDHVTEDDFDSFDSDDSGETYRKSGTKGSFDVANARLPDLPPGQNIYGITKIAEVAGKKMLKFRKSLSRMRTKRNSTDLGVLTVARTPSPPHPPPQCTAPTPASASAPMEKCASAASLSRRKYWSLRRFKRSLSSVSQHPSAAKETAMFYLSPAVDMLSSASSQERRSSAACSEASDVPSSRSSCGSTNTLVYQDKAVLAVANKRQRAPVERPHSPPPLPPDIPKRAPRQREKKTGNSSWYAECGLFDQTELANNHVGGQRQVSTKLDKLNSYSLYAEVGLWDAATYSHDTSQSSCGSDNTSACDNRSYVDSRFADEPLYQFYTAAVAEVQGRWRDDTDSDGYEEIGELGSQTTYAPRPTAMELIRPREGTITAHQRKLQEAKFEIITSEASYGNSLSVLEKHFMSSRQLHDESVLSKNDRRTLFSNVVPVRNCSTKFLNDLEACWQDSIMLHGICNIIYEHATSNFGVYVKYCSNQIYLDRTLRKLKEQHGKFAEALLELESSPVCQSLSLHSFLMLPMQRITRLPLLVDAMLTRLGPEDDEYSSCRLALATLNKIVQECNEGARRMERMEEILILNRQLEFSKEVKAVPIISSSRWLIKRGELTHLVWRGDEAKLTFGKKLSKVSLHLLLFTDMLLLARKKSEDSYLVIDYCPRNLIQIAVADDVPHLPVKFTSDNSKHLMLLTMLQNHEKKTVEMVLSCALESDRQRWLEAVNPPVSVNPGETVYPEWDCPQVTAIHSYVAGQPDELSLDVTDVVNVLRKMPDGWYQGERIRDGETGWFPGNYTVEVASAHVRARNLKQRYRLLALSGNYLCMQAKEKNCK